MQKGLTAYRYNGPRTAKGEETTAVVALTQHAQPRASTSSLGTRLNVLGDVLCSLAPVHGL